MQAGGFSPHRARRREGCLHPHDDRRLGEHDGTSAGCSDEGKIVPLLSAWGEAVQAANALASHDEWMQALAKTLCDAPFAAWAAVVTFPAGHPSRAQGSAYSASCGQIKLVSSPPYLQQLERLGIDPLTRRYGTECVPLLEAPVKGVDEPHDDFVHSFLLDADGRPIGSLGIATAAIKGNALGRLCEAVCEVAAAASETLRKAIDLAAGLRGGNLPVENEAINALSARERQIAELVVEGYSDLNIGQRLGISEHTVGAHLRRMYARLSVHRRLDFAMLYAASQRADAGSAGESRTSVRTPEGWVR
jgi:DNA-binding CsgD family transcriptional regulator